MNKRNYLIIPCLIISTFSFSQDFSHNVIAAQGDFSQMENMTLEWTIGESFVETNVTSEKIYTQGFQQPFLTTTRLNTDSLNNSTAEIVLYPNPVESLLYVYLKSNQNTKLYINIYDVSGKLIKQETILDATNNSALDVSVLSSGVYLMKFSNEDGSLIETHRIVKH